MTRANPHLAERLARITVDSVRALARQRVPLSVFGLVVTTVLATGYIAIGALDTNPLRSTISVQVLLPESGGLMPNQNVTFRVSRSGTSLRWRSPGTASWPPRRSTPARRCRRTASPMSPRSPR